MPHSLVALPTGTHTSWLDTPPPSPPPSPPPPPPRSLAPPRRRQPQATPQMLSRIHALQASLSTVRLSLDTRIHMSLSHRYSAFYCAHCTPRLTCGTCGPTCPLFRPNSSHSLFANIVDDEWYRQLACDKAKYREVTADMAARGTAVYASTVARWERAVARLRKSVEVPSEMWEAEGWPQARILDAREMVEFKRGWSFGGAWGRGMDGRGDEVVAPEVKKRKRGGSVDDDANHGLVEHVRKRVKRIR